MELAARLSENPKRKVLLIESRGADTDSAIPAPHGSFALQSEAFNWSDLTVPQEQLGGRRVMVSSADYDSWAKRGVAGWGWANVLPLSRRVEDHELGASTLPGTAAHARDHGARPQP